MKRMNNLHNKYHVPDSEMMIQIEADNYHAEDILSSDDEEDEEFDYDGDYSDDDASMSMKISNDVILQSGMTITGPDNRLIDSCNNEIAVLTVSDDDEEERDTSNNDVNVNVNYDHGVGDDASISIMSISKLAEFIENDESHQQQYQQQLLQAPAHINAITDATITFRPPSVDLEPPHSIVRTQSLLDICLDDDDDDDNGDNDDNETNYEPFPEEVDSLNSIISISDLDQDFDYKFSIDKQYEEESVNSSINIADLDQEFEYKVSIQQHDDNIPTNESDCCVIYGGSGIECLLSQFPSRVL